MSEEINESRPVHLECFQEIHRLNDRIKLLELKAHETARAQEKGIKRLHSGKKKLLKENQILRDRLSCIAYATPLLSRADLLADQKQWNESISAFVERCKNLMTDEQAVTGIENLAKMTAIREGREILKPEDL